jgi:peptidylprolyl isomerase
MEVKQGDKVKIKYEGKYENGDIFDSNLEGNNTLDFTIGEGKVIKGFEEGIIGMKKGDEKEIKLNPEQAYGPRRDDLEKEIPKSSLPKEQEPKEGMMLIMGTPDGRQFPVKIKKVDKEKVTLDLNHPLAGKTLIFKIKLEDIECS